MDIALSHCFVAVDDHDKALEFYCGLLGMEIRLDVSFEGMRWVTIGAPNQPGINIVLEPPLAIPNAPRADRELMEQLLAKGLLRAVVFSTDDVDGTFEKLRTGGAEVLEEPTDQPYGVRDCAFRDPSGNMLRIQSRR